jgi:hypothetical protein
MWARPFGISVALCTLWLNSLIGCGEDTATPSTAGLAIVKTTLTTDARMPDRLSAKPLRVLARSQPGVVGFGDDGLVYAVGESREPKKIPASEAKAIVGASATKQGFVAWSETEIFVGDSSRVSLAPITSLLAKNRARWVDAWTQRTWVTRDDGVLYLDQTSAIKATISDAGQVFAAISEGDTSALVFAEAGVYVITPPNIATRVTDSLGRVLSADHSNDGRVYIATESGLVVSEPTSTPGANQRRILPAVAGGSILAVTAYGPGCAFLQRANGNEPARTQLVMLEAMVGSPDAPLLGKAFAAPNATGLAADADGNLWLQGNEPGYFGFGTPISFATQVKPLMIKYCQDCHAPNRTAPVRAFDDYAIASEYANAIYERMLGKNKPVMPPLSSGKTPSDDEKSLITRWATGSKKP